MARLIVNPDTAEAWEWELPAGKRSVGRGSDNDLVLDHPSVSSRHCEVELTKRGLMLRDLGSMTGTLVGSDLVEERSLHPGQTFRVGEVSVKYEASVAGARGSRRAAGTSVSEATSLAIAGSDEPISFYRWLPGAFAYPLSANGLILIAAGGVVFLATGWLPLIGFLLTGYLFNYAKKIVAATAGGEDDVPDWPDVTNWAEDVVRPYLQLAVLVILTLGPALLLGVFLPEEIAFRRIWVLVAMAYGALLAPMGMLAVSMFDSFACLNPLALMWSILRIPMEYLVAALVFAAVMGAFIFSERGLQIIPVPFVPKLVAGFVNLYLIIVAMRILGLLYRAERENLGWFRR